MPILLYNYNFTRYIQAFYILPIAMNSKRACTFKKAYNYLYIYMRQLAQVCPRKGLHFFVLESRHKFQMPREQCLQLFAQELLLYIVTNISEQNNIFFEGKMIPR